VIMYGNFESPPDLPSASASGYADHSEQGLANFQQSLRLTHDPGLPQSNNTVIGHSYGSTVVGYAARDHGGLNANNLVLLGSPGTGVDSAGQLGVPPDHVWVGTSQNDAIRYVPSVNPVDWITRDDHTRFGLEPDDPSFGANTLPTDPTAGHNDYWSKPQSLDGMARIMTGQAPEGTPQ
jgi:pimeloyl-ACP methyl ester carboxylesterase